MRSIFDSKSEVRVYETLKKRWSQFVDIFPQMSVRSVLGFENMKEQFSGKALEYLQKASFDFVICDRDHVPIMVVEFDGIGRGLSCYGKYIRFVPVKDGPYRELKLRRKISACEWAGVPISVVSDPETDPVRNPDCVVTVLDALIGEMLSSRKCHELISEKSDYLVDAIDSDPSGEAVQMRLMELEFLAEQQNPIQVKIQKMRDLLPISCGEQFHPLRDRPGYVGARQQILGGLHLSDNILEEQILVSFDVYIRPLGSEDLAFQLANLLAEYGVLRKAIRTVGIAAEPWSRLLKETPWTLFK